MIDLNFFPLYIHYSNVHNKPSPRYSLEKLSFLDFQFEATQPIELNIEKGQIRLGCSDLIIPYNSLSYGNTLKAIVMGKTISSLGLKLFAPYPLGVDKKKVPLFWTPDSDGLRQWQIIHPQHIVT